MLNPRTLTPNEFLRFIDRYSIDELRDYVEYLIKKLTILGLDCDKKEFDDIVDILDYKSAVYMSDLRYHALYDIGNIIDNFNTDNPAFNELLVEIDQILNQEKLELGRW